MDFKLVLEKLIKDFSAKKIRYSLMGGFAMGLLGVHKSTVALDFLVNKKDLNGVHKIMAEMEYELAHKTENVSQYLSPLKIFGEVDFFHAFRAVSLKMLSRATDREIFEGAMTIKVLQPEDIIGMKVQAYVNDKSRYELDYADINELAKQFGNKLDWELVEEYFSIFDLEKTAQKLKRKYAAA